MGRDKYLRIPDSTLDLALEMQGDVLLEETEPMHDSAVLRPRLSAALRESIFSTASPLHPPSARLREDPPRRLPALSIVPKYSSPHEPRTPQAVTARGSTYANAYMARSSVHRISASAASGRPASTLASSCSSASKFPASSPSGMESVGAASALSTRSATTAQYSLGISELKRGKYNPPPQHPPRAGGIECFGGKRRVLRRRGWPGEIYPWGAPYCAGASARILRDVSDAVSLCWGSSGWRATLGGAWHMGMVVESSAGESAPASPKSSPKLRSAQFGSAEAGLTTALGWGAEEPAEQPADIAGAGAWGDKEKEGAQERKRDEAIEMGAIPGGRRRVAEYDAIVYTRRTEYEYEEPQPEATIAYTTPSYLSSSTAPPPLAHITTTSTSTSQPFSGRALSLKNLAPSPFAPPALPLPLPSTHPPRSSATLRRTLAPQPAPLGLSLGHGLGAGQGQGHASELDLGLSLGLGLGTPNTLVGVGAGAGGIAPGPPVVPGLAAAACAVCARGEQQQQYGVQQRGGTRHRLRRDRPARSGGARSSSGGAPRGAGALRCTRGGGAGWRAGERWERAREARGEGEESKRSRAPSQEEGRDVEMGKQQEQGEQEVTPERMQMSTTQTQHRALATPSTRACVDDAVEVYVRREDEDVVLLDYTNTATLETSSHVDELPDPLAVRDVPELPRRIPMREAIPEPTAPLNRGPHRIALMHQRRIPASPRGRKVHAHPARYAWPVAPRRALRGPDALTIPVHLSAPPIRSVVPAAAAAAAGRTRVAAAGAAAAGRTAAWWRWRSRRRLVVATRRPRRERGLELDELARCGGCFLAADGPDHSLSVAGEPGSSLVLVEEPETSDVDEEVAGGRDGRRSEKGHAREAAAAPKAAPASDGQPSSQDRRPLKSGTLPHSREDFATEHDPPATLPSGAERDTEEGADAEEGGEADEGGNPRAGANPGQQRARLLKLDPDHDVVPYLDEGEGYVYFTGVLQNNAVQELDPKQLPHQMIIKWGVSNCVSRRQLEYHACEVGQTQLWFCAFKVDHRLLAERIIRLRLLEEGRRHREYHYMHPGGSLEEIERLAVECLEEMGEQNIAW
ncbi:hypothetical protein B0H14DRAFT_2626577 [Mycena olivaceomarginata]|nr:hypothetical protein B0H14DRAFT_2626577 [Mycena olivaceomarginata]